MKLEVIPLSMANAFLLEDGKRTFLVDVGLEKDHRKLEEVLAGRRPDWVVLTHVHVDHAGGARLAQQRWGSKIAVPSAEAGWAKEGLRRVPPAMIWWAYPIVWVSRFVPTPLLPSFIPDIEFDADFELRSIGIEGELIPTPGHSPGHLSLYLPELRTVLVGDAVAGAPRKADSPRMSCFGEDFDQMVKSAQKLASIDADQFLPSHGAVISKLAMTDFVQRLQSRRPRA